MRSLVLGDWMMTAALRRVCPTSRRASAWCGMALLITWVGLASAGDTGGPGDKLETMLTAKELQKYFAPYVPAVRSCYVAGVGIRYFRFS